MMSCNICTVKLKSTEQYLYCGNCSMKFHAKCAGLTSDDLKYIKKEKINWKCPTCTNLNRMTRNDDSFISGTSLQSDKTIEVNLDNEVSAESHSTEQTFSEPGPGITLSLLYNEMLDTKALYKASLDDINKRLLKLDGIYQLVSEAVEENKKLKMEVKILQNRVTLLEKIQNQNIVEINGIPHVPDENIMDTVINTFKTGLDFEIANNSIDYCYRKQTRNSKNDGMIVVKFVSRYMKDEIMAIKRKKRLSANNCGFNSNERIFFNDWLSPKAKSILYAAKNVKREKGYKYIWARNGNILARKSDGGDIIRLSELSDLDSSL